MLNKNQMELDTTKLANALKNEPVEIQEIIIKNVNEILEEYAEDCCAKDVIKEGKLDCTNQTSYVFALPALYKASSYKSFGIRYFIFEALVSTYVGKNFHLTLEVACGEEINDIPCTTQLGEKILACNWLSPFKIEITHVEKEISLFPWNPNSEEDIELINKYPKVSEL